MAWWRPTWPEPSRGRVAAGAALCLFALPAAADETASPASALPESGRGHVRDVPDGLTLLLSDGRTLRLAGLDAPLPPLGSQAAADPSPLPAQSREVLATLALDREVAERGPIVTDRYGREVAQITRDDGVWLEGALLDAGAARVATTPEQSLLARAMLDREAAARLARQGLWEDPDYAVRRPDDLDYTTGLFELVEGRVRRVEKQRGGLRLDFAEGGFEVRLDRAALARLGDDPRPETLAGRRIRVRGWLRWAGNPFIDLGDPAEIELLDRAP